MPEAPTSRSSPATDLDRHSGAEMPRLLREFVMAMRRGLTLGECRSCEVFYLMSKLGLQEFAQRLSEGERADFGSWIETGSVLDLDTGCEDACPLIRLYSRMSR